MNVTNDVHPPAWPLKFLRYFLKEAYLEEIEGDMEEIFLDNVEQFSLSKARRLYTWEMLKLLRPRLIKNFKTLPTFNQAAMFNNYFKIAWRSLIKKNRLLSYQHLRTRTGHCLLFVNLHVRAG